MFGHGVGCYAIEARRVFRAGSRMAAGWAAVLMIFGGLIGAPRCRAAIDIRFDYTYDSAGFFSGTNLGRRAVLDAAAGVFESRLQLENFGAVVPSGGNTWSLSMAHPGTGYSLLLDNLVIPANTITIYVGALQLGDSLLGTAGARATYTGDTAWTNLFEARDSPTNFDSLGGAIIFDIDAAWYFDPNPQTDEPFPEQIDFYSLAQHEIAHILGFDSAKKAFQAGISGTNFIGPHVTALYGGPAPLGPESAYSHWQSGLQFDGRPALMNPGFSWNVRQTATELDFAALQDIGYLVNAVPEPSTAALAGLGCLLLLTPRRRGEGEG